MAWDLKEALEYYRRQGAPQDQSALISLLKEIQKENNGSIPKGMIPRIAQTYGIKEGVPLALIKRIPGLRLGNVHCLELCTGKNCGRHAQLAVYAEELCRTNGNITLRYVPCMRMCGKGPNIRWDGTVYHQATEDLLCKLIEDIN